MTFKIENILDLEAYPLDQPDHLFSDELVSEKQRNWQAEGAFLLSAFLRPGMADRAAEELTGLMNADAFRHDERHNIYFSDDSREIPSALTSNQLRTSNWTLTCDQLGGTIIRTIYEWPPLCEFIRRVLALPSLHRMADPMACLNVMSYGDGDCLDWHFDRAEFAVTLLLQAPESGGQFEYRRALRTRDNPNYDGVQMLLKGKDRNIRTIEPTAGNLSVFAGYGSAHRVSPIVGSRPRMMAVLSFMEEPDFQYGPEDRMRFYGRSSPQGSNPEGAGTP